MTDFITDEMVEAALTADMEFRAGADWREVLDHGEQEFEKGVMRAALVAAMRAAWRPIESAPDLERVFVAGVQPRHGTTAAYWYIGEDFTDENRKPMDHPDALLWQPLPPPPAKEGA